MEDPGGPDPNGGDRPLFQSRRRQNRTRLAPGPLLLGVALLIGAAGAIWFGFRSFNDSPPSVGSTPTTDSAASNAVPAEATLTLPALDGSDQLLRDVLAQLSDHPEWVAWLVPEDLVRRFVAAVVNVAAGDSPRTHVDFMEPEGPFQVSESDGRLLIDTRGYRRYDLFAETFVSLDTGGAARFYRLLHPLFEEAHKELGLPDRTFDDSFALALGNLLAVEPQESDVEIELNESIYEFTDPRVEALTPAQKHILRLGPANAHRVQDKLRELSATLGIQPIDPMS